jgi:hypothetical protein
MKKKIVIHNTNGCGTTMFSPHLLGGIWECGSSCFLKLFLLGNASK